MKDTRHAAGRSLLTESPGEEDGLDGDNGLFADREDTVQHIEAVRITPALLEADLRRLGVTESGDEAPDMVAE